MAFHCSLTGDDIHVINTWTYANSAARDAATGFTADDVYKVAVQEDDYSIWVLVDHSPITWQQLGGVVVSAINHCELDNLLEDCHTIYMPTNASRAFTQPVSGQDPTLDNHLATKLYTDTASANALTQANVYTDTEVASVSAAADEGDNSTLASANTYSDQASANALTQALAADKDTFLELDDTPGNYSGKGLQLVRVNSGETALEFAPSGSSGGGDDTEKVKSTSTDPSAGYLDEEIVGVDGIDVDVIDRSGYITPFAMYYLDEAASGITPTQVLDKASSPEDLDIVYSGGEPYYFEDADGNRGLNWDTEGGDGKAWLSSVDGTKFRTNLDGTQKATYEVVCRVRAVVSQNSRIIHIGSGTDAGSWTLQSDPVNQMMVIHNSTTVAEYEMEFDLFGKMVVHVVLDSTESSAEDRIKVYRNGIRIYSKNGVSGITLNETLSISSTDYFAIGNRISDRAIDGKIWFAALYDNTLGEDQIKEHAVALLENDDDNPKPNADKVLRISGGEYFYVESEDDDSTSSTGYQQKLRLNAEIEKAGTYKLEWYAEIWHTDSGRETGVRIQQDDSINHAVAEVEANASDTHPISGFRILFLSLGSYTFDMDYRDTDGTASAHIQRARMLLRRMI